MKLSQTYHLNDKTLKYMSFAQSKRQHQYLNLPGEYDVRLPQEMVFTDMTSARGDEIYYNNEDLLIDLEEESEYISPKTLEKFIYYQLKNWPKIIISFKIRNISLLLVSQKETIPGSNLSQGS